MSRIGDIHNLPVEEHPDADRKPGRPWLLAHTPGAAKRCVLAYGTTKDTEEVEGATALDIRWRRLSGSTTGSRFFTARLRNHDPGEIGERVGYAREYAGEIRASLRAALGIGSGVGVGPAGSIERGQIVSLHSIVRERIGARFAILVTRPEYLRLRRYQLLVPVYDAGEVDLMSGEVSSAAAWVAALPGAPPLKSSWPSPRSSASANRADPAGREGSWASFGRAWMPPRCAKSTTHSPHTSASDADDITSSG